MADVTVDYTAKRNLTNLLGAPVTIVFRASVDVMDDISSSSVQSIDGTQQQTTLNYLRKIRTYKTGIIPPADIDEMEEFLASVSAGEVFTITDPEDSDRVMTVKFMGNFQRARVTDSEFLVWKFTFSVVEQV